MPLVTYLDIQEVESWRHDLDPELGELLGDVRRVTGEDWCVHKLPARRGLFGFRTSRRDLYRLLVRIAGREYQIINFGPVTYGGDGFGYEVDRRTVIAFLFGLRNGHDSKRTDAVPAVVLNRDAR